MVRGGSRLSPTLLPGVVGGFYFYFAYFKCESLTCTSVVNSLAKTFPGFPFRINGNNEFRSAVVFHYDNKVMMLYCFLNVFHNSMSILSSYVKADLFK